MPDLTLHENGEPCPYCCLRRDDQDTTAILRPTIACNYCGGIGRVALPTETIIDRAVDWARKHHWPAFDERNKK